MKACATCQSWAIKTSWLKDSDMAPCDLSVRYTALRPDHACALHTPLGPALFAKRVAWLGRIDEKHKQGVSA